MNDIEKRLEHLMPLLISVWRNNSLETKLSRDEIDKVGKALLELQRGLTGDRKLAGSGYMQNNNSLGAYLLYYWAVTYMQISYIAQDIDKQLKVLCHKKHISLLDIGSGPGPAAKAIIDSLTKINCEIEVDVTCIDVSSKALLDAEKIIKQKNICIKTIVCNIEDCTDDNFLKEFSDKKFDLIIMSHALNELWKGSVDVLDGIDHSAVDKRCNFLLRTSNFLFEDGLLVLCEPALLQTSRNLLAVRDGLIKNKMTVVSPCYLKNNLNFNCPALTAGANHTCHADFEWSPCEPPASLAKSAGLDRQSVKMSFVVMRKTLANDVELNECHDNNKLKICGRIVSEGMLNKAGRIRFVLCDGQNRITISAKKNEPYATEIGFFGLRRLEKVCFVEPEVRGDKVNISYGICSNTQMLKDK